MFDVMAIQISFIVNYDVALSIVASTQYTQGHSTSINVCFASFNKTFGVLTISIQSA